MKQKPIRSPKHLKNVRKLPCMIKDYNGDNCNGTPIVAHHLTFINEGGMGLKTGDNWTIPLCHRCHLRLHHMGEKATWKCRGIGLDEVTNYATKLWSVTNESKNNQF